MKLSCILHIFSNESTHHFGLFSFQKVGIVRRFFSFFSSFSFSGSSSSCCKWKFDLYFHSLFLQSYMEWSRSFFHTLALFVIDTRSLASLRESVARGNHCSFISHSSRTDFLDLHSLGNPSLNELWLISVTVNSWNPTARLCCRQWAMPSQG